jgi:hypothetical protein
MAQPPKYLIHLVVGTLLLRWCGFEGILHPEESTELPVELLVPRANAFDSKVVAVGYLFCLTLHLPLKLWGRR